MGFLSGIDPEYFHAARKYESLRGDSDYATGRI